MRLPKRDLDGACKDARYNNSCCSCTLAVRALVAFFLWKRRWSLRDEWEWEKAKERERERELLTFRWRELWVFRTFEPSANDSAFCGWISPIFLVLCARFIHLLVDFTRPPPRRTHAIRWFSFFFAVKKLHKLCSFHQMKENQICWGESIGVVRAQSLSKSYSYGNVSIYKVHCIAEDFCRNRDVWPRKNVSQNEVLPSPTDKSLRGARWLEHVRTVGKVTQRV